MVIGHNDNWEAPLSWSVGRDGLLRRKTGSFPGEVVGAPEELISVFDVGLGDILRLRHLPRRAFFPSAWERPIRATEPVLDLLAEAEKAHCRDGEIVEIFRAPFREPIARVYSGDTLHAADMLAVVVASGGERFGALSAAGDLIVESQAPGPIEGIPAWTVGTRVRFEHGPEATIPSLPRNWRNSIDPIANVVGSCRNLARC